ncbi:MAG TPA: CHASE domain-containing protein [Kouleothrix sp.]|uniref:CHASE domain-containing protein n=1 Tax=Kouleothrix sp. TaxID=2779161 RepID=UPI002B8100FF|nr:CHASE domain-containing protein [Kouleothrix sp.]HRC74163.1 CHASE domain-containing protein [Kouleothrix sp.]
MLQRLRSQRPKPRWFWLPYLVFALAFGTALLSTVYFATSSRAYDQLRFSNQVQQTQDSISARLETYISMLRGVGGLFAASASVERAEFRAYVMRLDIARHYPGAQGIGFSQRVAPADRAALLARMRAQGFPDFHIWPEGQRAEYHTIVYLEPQDRRNAAAIGYDMFSEAIRRAAMEQARDGGQPAASGKVTLVQEIDQNKQPGFLIYTPVYQGGGIPASPAERQRALLGFAYSPFRVYDLLNGIFGSQQQPQIAFRIFDGAEQRPDQLLYESAPGAAPGRAALASTTTLPVAGRLWTITYTTLPAFDDPNARYLPPFIMFTGTLASVALLIMVRAQVVARAQAEAAVRTRDIFLSIAAHELKSPLTALAGNAQLLLRRASRDPNVAPRDIAVIRVIDQQSHRLNRLITVLLDHSRLQAGSLAIERTPFDIVALVRQVVEETQPTLVRHSIALEADADTLVVDGDELRLEQVIQNLISNAIKYSPAGGAVLVRVARDGESAAIAVIDHGMGIPASALPSLFEQFYRAPNAEAQNIGGIGIGLYLARQIVSQHGGTIAVESAEGAGSTFTLRLPLDARWQQPAAAFA